MAVCRHCGAIIDDGLEYCPDCGQKNTEQVDESYLDNLLNSLVSAEPVRPAKKESSAPKNEKKTEGSDGPVAFIPTQADMDFLLKNFEKNPDELDSYNLFDADEELEEEAYNIFDELEDVDVEAMIADELEEEPVKMQEEPEPYVPEEVFAEEENYPEEEQNVDDFFAALAASEEEVSEEEAPEELFDMPSDELEDFFATPETEEGFAVPEENEEFFILPDENEEFPTVEEDALENLFVTDLEEPEAEQTPVEDFGLSTEDFAGLDDLFQGFDESDVEEMSLEDASSEESYSDLGLEELLVSEEINPDSGKKAKKKVGFWKRLFGNVPVDPSKIKPEPTPEEIAAAKQKKADEKKKAADEKKLATAEKKDAAKKKKEEKAQQAQLAKEEKKQRKMEEAKQLLEEMGETRINRVGATIVFVFFAIIAVVLIVGSNLVTYSISVKNAKKNFELAYNNDVKYYTEAYNHIYGLEMRNEEDQELGDKIMTVMFVNKELNSYNSYMLLDDYESALHSLVKGLYRYGKYIEQAFELEIDKDMDFVRTQIIKELENKFDVSEDEAEVLRNLLFESLSDDEKAVAYSKEIYKIVDEAEDLQ